MMKLRKTTMEELDMAMDIINMAKAHLKAQGIDQWQTGYPDRDCLQRDIENGKAYFAVDDDDILGYLCVDYDGEPAYDLLKGEWSSNEPYVVVHRMAFADEARGRGISEEVFGLVEQMSKEKGINFFRVDTDEDNKKMKHILGKCGFTYRGTIWFDNSEKIAYDKEIK